MIDGAADGPPWPWGDLDSEALAASVRAHLPTSLTGELTSVGAGDYCLAYRMEGWIVRVAKHAKAAQAIRREACVLGRISDRLPLAVPRLEYHEGDGAPPFTLHREVPGTALTRAAWAALPEPARGRIAERLASFLRTLHALADDARACGLPQRDGAALATRLRGAARAELGGLLGPSIAAGLDDFLQSHARVAGGPPAPALLHADVAPGHLLYDETSGELTGVIDFGDVVLGPPARDFIYLYEDFGSERCEEVAAAYAGAEAPALMRDVRAWYLLEAVDWTLERLAAGARDDVAHGLAEIRRELGA